MTVITLCHEYLLERNFIQCFFWQFQVYDSVLHRFECLTSALLLYSRRTLLSIPLLKSTPIYAKENICNCTKKIKKPLIMSVMY